MNERDFQMYLNFEQHRVTDRFFSRLDPETVEALTPKQLNNITRALVRAFLYPSRRLLDIRWVFPFFRNRYYLVILLGPEIREGEPRYFNRFLSRSRWMSNFLFLLLAACILFSSAVGLVQILGWLLT